MCGVAGYWDVGGKTSDLAQDIRSMLAAVVHRGPDGSGEWIDPSRGIALGHRRLSILDLSEAGSQPMTSPSGRYVVSFNGEFYNWRDLRAEEEAHGASWRGHSDTEVFLAVCDRLGVRTAIERSHGMFALAIWDREAGTLTLARDRLGEKPMYYGWCGSLLLFGSELKALRAHSAWSGRVDRAALTLFLRHMYIPAPHSIYENVRKLHAGAMITFRGAALEWPEADRYWSILDVARRARNNLHTGSPEEITDDLHALLRRAVQREMVADVPVGAFLSGGIDSSLVAALMQECSVRPAKTFTVGFSEAAYDESRYAAAVARHLGTEHTAVHVTPSEAREVIPKLPSIYDEPFADVSQIPTYLVSSVARKHVTVALSGDGGDEAFAGYDRHRVGPAMWNWLAPVPRFARRALAKALRAVAPGQWDAVLGFLPTSRRLRLTGDRLHKLASVLNFGAPADLYVALTSHWQDPASIVLGAREPSPQWSNSHFDGSDQDVASLMVLMDTMTYLPDDIFAKVDRAAMAVSLETRAPFVDHSVVEFAWRIPPALRASGGVGKMPLRRVLARFVPTSLFERPKSGFAVPIDSWLREPLRAWAGDLLSEASLRRAGLFAHAPVMRKWEEHQAGHRNWQYLLWDVLVAQAWYFAQPA